MKFEISSSTLLYHLQTITKVISSKSPVKLLENILFELRDQELLLTSSDAETRIQMNMPLLDLEGSGSFLLSQWPLIDILNNLPDQPIGFDVNEENYEINVSYRSGSFKLLAFSSEDYPEMPAMSEGSNKLEIDASVLLEALDRTEFATAGDPHRPVMNGIYFDLHPEDLTVVSTDGHKLVRLIHKSIQTGQTASFIFQKKPSNLLRLILQKVTGNVTIAIDGRNASIANDTFSMRCVLIEGRYPNYNSVIPDGNPYTITADRELLLSALKRVAVFCMQSTGLIRLSLEKNKLSLYAGDPSLATTVEEHLDVSYDGVEMVVGFKAPFLIDVIDNIKGNNVLISLADPVRAALFLPEEEKENEEYCVLLMPMVVKN